MSRFTSMSLKLKRVSLNEALRDSKTMENMKKLNEIIFYYKNIDIHKTA